MSFGEKIKSARISKGLTQRQLADAIGAKHNSISDWEKNKNKPDPDTIELLCGVLDISPNYLIGTNLNKIEPHSPQELNLIKKYRCLDFHGQDIIDTILEKEYERCVEDKDEEKETIKLVARSKNGPYKITREQAIALAKSASEAPNDANNKDMF